ncbi:DUF1810 domain-containing protein [Pseudomonas capeferrum]|uniref:DUF1810 domain-containing protein n=1 Tax=Pseudomonas capeferrum TaxID=1495066 RepID=UPI0015E27647|nr:DUF1810 domain-containing protein [Pseudomonas capeferrum]MBA1205202.1 DUF1810 domain-containing protein [Pseudomonas capeferrum]
MSSSHDLSRFLDAQQAIYPQVMEELLAGRKTRHWMWFIFPQLRGLGHSEMAERYGLSGLDEARAYLEHEVLGPRLAACVNALVQHADKSALQILGHPDDLKLRSCLTLFAAVDESAPLFQFALVRFFGGEPDARTLLLLGR